MLPTILIVDDEPEFLEIISWALRREGYPIEHAIDGVSAISKAKSIHPGLIVLDLMLPELDGTAVCEILKHSPSTATIPILMLTGCATEECKWVAFNAGANAYLTKPCRLKELVGKIKELINCKSAEETVCCP
jgi:two-component system, OmpR family, alkaline phosphatase synthesis response regulator PhoP